MNNMQRKDIDISVVQPDVHWKDTRSNLNHYNKILATQYNTNLILLPEMFNTGFCTEPASLAESMDGPSINWMKQTASKLHCSIAGSLIISEKQQYFNRLIYVDQSGKCEWYDKRHLFRMGNENSNFTAGDSKLIISLEEWRISFNICYDLRFPVWSRNQDDYDILINCANWPAARDDAWQILLKARSIENLCYIIGVNRTGKDGNGISYIGHSMAVNPEGSIIKEAGESPELFTFTLSWKALSDYREKFPAWKDRDHFNIIS